MEETSQRAATLPTRLWIVGEGPSEAVWRRLLERHPPELAERLSRRLALTGAVGKRLAGMLGEDWPAGLVPWRSPGRERYRLLNLQDVPWTRRPFQASQARAWGETILAGALVDGAPVLALGRRVAHALGLAPETPFLTWSRTPAGGVVGLAPHPSRRSRWWNDAGRATAAVLFLRAARLGLALGEKPFAADGRFGWVKSPRSHVGRVWFKTREEAAADATSRGLRVFWTWRLAFQRLPSSDGVSVTAAVRVWLSRHEAQAR